MPKVYLAGPISGLTLDGATDWRDRAMVALKSVGISAFSPLRGKEFLRDRGELNGSYEDHPLSTARGIMTRDHWDCLTADLILVNLKGADRVSIGTVMELAWAHVYRVPVVAVMEDAGNPHAHPMVDQAINYRVTELSDAVALVRAVLLPG